MTRESAAAYWRHRLREGLLPEDCPVFETACGLLSCEDIESFSLGDLKVKTTAAGQRLRQAEGFMAPWLRDDGFAFREVPPCGN